MTRRRVLIAAGPTCSGKSGLAMDLAERFAGVIINADAMQSYRDLRVLTARPTQEDEDRVPHALYGVRDAVEPATAAWWRGAALRIIAATDRLPILCGGTGLYLNALLQGLAEIPDPGDSARAQARGLLEAEGPAALHARLMQVDPATASRTRPTDGQRLARAWEVFCGTGQGLAAWHAQAGQGGEAFDARAIILQPDRASLRASIARRWNDMLDLGAIAEVRALRGKNLDPALPLLRAHGVPELGAFLDGAITLDEAGRRAVLAIGQYTKRQATWLRHHRLAGEEHSFNIHARWSKNAQESSAHMAALNDFMSRAVDGG